VIEGRMRGSWKRLGGAAAFVLGALMLAGGGFWALDAPGPALGHDNALFRVREGDTADAIARRLQDDGLVRSAMLVRVVTRVMGTDSAFKAGNYRFRTGSTALEIYRALVSGEQSLVKVTVPEGYTMGKLAALLERRRVCSRAEFLRAAGSKELLASLRIPGRTAEGYLFPDTYFLPEDYPAEEVVRTMVENFHARVRQLEPATADWKPERLHENVILASIVEREYRIPAEAPIIASVFRNRLTYGIGLESCATVEYIITEIEGRPHPGFITGQDIKINSPYNTYKWAGLPPGPISNPGLVALDAALHAPQTDYYYFVLKDPATGEHHFSKSLRGHIEAMRYYLKSPS
jgi:UPF0755 protein